MADETDPTALQVAQEIAAEMAGKAPLPLDPAEAEARTQYWAEVREREAFERQLLEWEQQRELEEQQRRQAEAEAIAQHEHRRQQQREIADRLRQQQAARDAQEAARAAADTRASLARQELERRERVAAEERWAFFRSLGPMGNPAPQRNEVLDKLNEIDAKLDPPEPTLHERLTDPRRFKFDWQP